MSDLEKLRGMFCYKILPLVYDDSLSYYEVLCKLVAKLNEIIEVFNDDAEAWLDAYVLEYFDETTTVLASYDAETETLTLQESITYLTIKDSEKESVE